MTSPTYNILMYSHDTYGLGHIRRTMAIAKHLRNKDTNILILTGSPIAGRFNFPKQVDYVRIPGMIKQTNEEYIPLAIRIDQEQALNIRTNIILATAKTFKPDLFIIDKEPLGLKKEVLPTLIWLKNKLKHTRTVLGLRDILDDAEVIRKDWHDKDVYRYLESLYDEIWIYGNKDIYNPINQYKIPPAIHDRVQFTGYIPRNELKKNARSKVRRQFRLLDDDVFVLVTTGGGGDGKELLEQYLAMHDYYPTSLPLKTVLITGPFMPKTEREKIKRHAKQHGIKTLPFHPRMEEMIRAADIVISMGGYNTLCEILTQQTPSLIIPRETPRQEQLIRAQRLKERGLIDYLRWSDVTPQLLREKIFALLENKEIGTAMKEFQLTGLDTILTRLDSFRNPQETDTEMQQGNG